MKSSEEQQLKKRRRTYVRLIGEIHHALNQALTEENERRGLTRADIARMLGVHRSSVTKKLAGTANMTLETLADLAFAMDRPVKVSIPARNQRPGGNQISQPAIIAPAAADPRGAKTTTLATTLAASY